MGLLLEQGAHHPVVYESVDWSTEVVEDLLGGPIAVIEDLMPGRRLRIFSSETRDRAVVLLVDDVGVQAMQLLDLCFVATLWLVHDLRILESGPLRKALHA